MLTECSESSRLPLASSEVGGVCCLSPGLVRFVRPLLLLMGFPVETVPRIHFDNFCIPVHNTGHATKIVLIRSNDPAVASVGVYLEPKITEMNPATNIIILL